VVQSGASGATEEEVEGQWRKKSIKETHS